MRGIYGLTVVGAVAMAATAWAQGHMGHRSQPQPAQGGPTAPGPMTPAPPAPIRTTRQELHTHGGVPPGWTFLMPPGDPAAGRTVFVALGCASCHAIQSEAVDAGGIGPELTGMGAHHPAEYFAEKLVNPNRVIIEGPGYTGPDGRSTMPDYTESLTVRQLIDLVAYLKSLAPASSDPMGHPVDGSGQKPGM